MAVTDWLALGYDTWDAYCKAEFHGARLRLPREERRDVVSSLRDAGLSTRAIASATGVGHATVVRDHSSGGPNEPPAEDDTVTVVVSHQVSKIAHLTKRQVGKSPHLPKTT